MKNSNGEAFFHLYLLSMKAKPDEKKWVRQEDKLYERMKLADERAAYVLRWSVDQILPSVLAPMSINA